jgi:RND superfamily putative drug exporter
MAFDRIANGLTKHYKMAIAIWIIALMISVPAILRVNSAVDYQTSFSSGTNYESVRAQDVLEANFQQSVANGTIIIVLQSDNMSDAASRDFVLALQQRIQSSSDVKYMLAVTSIYTYYSNSVLNQTIMSLGPMMRPAEQNVSMGAFLLWGIPAMHVANWEQSHSDSDAYNATSAWLVSYLKQQHPDQNIAAFTLGYYQAFAKTWNATAIVDPGARATSCVNNVAPSVINMLPSDQKQMKQILLGVLAGFNLTSFNNINMLHSFTLNMLGTVASIRNSTFLQEVYDLGPSYQQGEVSAYVRSVVANGTLATYPVTIPQQLLTSFLSSNDKTMLIQLSFSISSSYAESNGDKPLLNDVAAIRNVLSQLKVDTGAPIATYVTGDAAISRDMQASSSEEMGLIEPITIVIILVLMGIFLRSVLGQLLPLGAVGVAVGMSQALVFVIGSTVAHINYTVVTMLFVVLMGVGTDYSIFLISRYREERIRGATRERAVHVSINWAGESIVTSGATVIIAFFAMSTSSFSMVQTMGLVLGMSIVVALLVALTLVPSILMLVGNRVFWPTTGKRWDRFAQKLMEKKRAGHHGYFHRAASFAVNHAKVIIVAAIVVSIPTTYLFMTAETSFDFIGSMGNPESIQGMNAMTHDFGAGGIMPTEVVITGDTVVYDGRSFNNTYLDAVDNITATIAANSMVQKVTGITRPYGERVDYRNLATQSDEQSKQTIAYMLKSMGSDNKSVLLTVVLKDQPEKASAVNYMPTFRTELANAKALQPALASSTILVGGATAQTYDLSLSTTQQFNNIEILVVIGIFLVLMIVLGSILLPAFAVVSIAMSISWSFAATILVFGTWLGKPVLWLIPLILFVMLMGIGMDYNVFILTRIREEVHKGKDTKQAVVDAVDWTGGIISALALIMGGAFGSLMISSNAMLQEFGFALLLAVLLDAMVVRTYIVPAALTIMDKHAWWAPGRLQREGREEKRKKKGQS